MDLGQIGRKTCRTLKKLPQKALCDNSEHTRPVSLVRRNSLTCGPAPSCWWPWKASPSLLCIHPASAHLSCPGSLFSPAHTPTPQPTFLRVWLHVSGCHCLVREGAPTWLMRSERDVTSSLGAHPLLSFGYEPFQIILWVPSVRVPFRVIVLRNCHGVE